MPNPLGILAGLASVGAQGTGGALGGEVEGRVLKSQMDAQAQDGQLRALRALLAQQQLALGQQPTYQYHQGNLIKLTPGSDPQFMPVPQGPLDPVKEAQRKKAEAEANLATARIPQVGKAPTPQLPADLAEAWGAYQRDNPGKSYTDFYKWRMDQQHPDRTRPHFDTPHISTDASGNEVARVPTRGPDGAVTGYKTIPLGPGGKPMETPGQAANRSASTEHLRALTAAAGGRDAGSVRARQELTQLRGDLTAQRSGLMRDRALYMDPILREQTGLTPEQRKARLSEIEGDLADIDKALRAIQGERKVPGANIPLPTPKPAGGSDPLGLR